MRKTVVRSFSIPPKLLKELERAAEEESRTYSELVREAIRQYLRNKRLDEMELRTLMRARSSARSLGARASAAGANNSSGRRTATKTRRARA